MRKTQLTPIPKDLHTLFKIGSAKKEKSMIRYLEDLSKDQQFKKMLLGDKLKNEEEPKPKKKPEQFSFW